MDPDADDENFITIGNPLPLIEEDEALPKPVKYQELSMKDARGRPLRFHGAFTGGFSAGYFNTVATPEGFQPSTFVSSRGKKADQAQSQHPEDFMDDEDFGEHGIASRQIKTTSKFESEKMTAARQLRQVPTEGLIPADVLASLIQPASLPMGVRLLKKMGWKEGQGVGPRQMKKRKHKTGRKAVDTEKIYGCALPPSKSDGESQESSDEDYGAGVTFAPKDVTPISLAPKDNVHGIGYSGINPHSALTSAHFSLFDDPQAPSAHFKTKGIRGQAFGVGALHNDDEDIYAQDNLSRYDFAIGEELEDNLHGWTAPRPHKGQQNQGTDKVIESFMKSRHKGFSKKIYPPPKLPRDFRPFHAVRKTEVTLTESQQTSGNKERYDASSRSELLGEAPEFRSVFDLVPESDKKRMAALKPSKVPSRPNRWDKKEHRSSDSPSEAGSQQTAGHSQPSLQSNSQSQHSSQPKTSNHMANKGQVAPPQPTAFSTTEAFKPFANNPDKQQRYEAFLQAKKKGETYKYEAGGMMTEWEQEHEREEFMRAAQLFTHINSVMAARFTTATHADSDTTAAMEEQQSKDEEKAAEMKLYGKLTRETLEWHPQKNLCKYFNVPNPYPESTVVGLITVKRDKFSLYNLLHIPQEPKPAPGPAPQTLKALPAPPGSKPKKSIFSEETLAKVNQGKTLVRDIDQADSDKSATSAEAEVEITPEEQPPMDLFKAIFSESESSSDSSDDSDDDDLGKKAGLQTADPKLKTNLVQVSGANSVPERMGDANHEVEIEEPGRTEPIQLGRSEPIVVDTDSDGGSHVRQMAVMDSYGPSLPPELYGPALPVSDRSPLPHRHHKARSPSSYRQHKTKSPTHKRHERHGDLKTRTPSCHRHKDLKARSPSSNNHKEHQSRSPSSHRHRDLKARSPLPHSRGTPKSRSPSSHRHTHHKAKNKKEKKTKSKQKKEKKKRSKHKKHDNRMERKQRDNSSSDSDSDDSQVSDLQLLERLKNIVQ